MTETWQTAQVGGSGGCMEDGKGTLYMSGGGGNIVAVDTETLTVKTTPAVPQYVHGISIDFLATSGACRWARRPTASTRWTRLC